MALIIFLIVYCGLWNVLFSLNSLLILAMVFINYFSLLLDPDLALLSADSVLVVYTSKSHQKHITYVICIWSSCLVS